MGMRARIRLGPVVIERENAFSGPPASRKSNRVALIVLATVLLSVISCAIVGVLVR